MAVQVRHRQARAGGSAGGWFSGLTFRPRQGRIAVSTHISGWGWVCEERVALILGSLDRRNRQSPVGTLSVLPQWIPEQIPALGCPELHAPRTQLI